MIFERAPEPMPIEVALAAWNVAGATNEPEARNWVSIMRLRGARPAEVALAWDAFQEAQEKAVQVIHSTPSPQIDYSEGPPCRDRLDH